MKISPHYCLSRGAFGTLEMAPGPDSLGFGISQAVPDNMSVLLHGSNNLQGVVKFMGAFLYYPSLALPTLQNMHLLSRQRSLYSAN
jgi:hypothetical protein